MRCLALAMAARDRGIDVSWSATRLPEGLTARLQAEGITPALHDAEPGSPADADATALAARRARASLVVVDGYQFPDSFEVAVAATPASILAFDDFQHASHAAATWILNQNAHARTLPYGGRSGLLLGLDFLLLRREFRCAVRQTPSLAVRRVLVTLGGSDPRDGTLRIWEALASVAPHPLEVTLLYGPLANRPAAIQHPRHAVSIQRDVRDMVPFLQQFDAVICAGGATCWELATLGIPCLALAVIDHQIHVVRSMGEAGAAIACDWSQGDDGALQEPLRRLLSLDGATLFRMGQAGARLVDGRGAERVLDAMGFAP
jgi:spore coat polysaccharide biosynthesis predicted glycosyltransferase SpsG